MYRGRGTATRRAFCTRVGPRFRTGLRCPAGLRFLVTVGLRLPGVRRRGLSLLTGVRLFAIGLRLAACFRLGTLAFLVDARFLVGERRFIFMIYT